MNFLPLIEQKRDGQELSAESLGDFARAAASNDCQPEQLGALLMAIYLNGLTDSETRSLTLAMRDSGSVLSFPPDSRPLVDKHSTGGVGDKVSLVLAPLLAALDFRVPMISGRGLGITGGTLDKMESIPGCRTHLSPRDIIDQVQQVGCVIAGQSEEMIPADRVLYATRDISGTIPSIPLITASILSKKLAENIGALLLDVKFGSAAFMPTAGEARRLAHAMARLGRECGLRIRAMLTDMNTPLGRAAGNWLEVREAVECLDGRGPADLSQLVLESAAHLLELSDRAESLHDARTMAAHVMQSDRPLRKFEEMIAMQGADMNAFRQKLDAESGTSVVIPLLAEHDGVVGRCDALTIGKIVHELGGGRSTRSDTIDPWVGVDKLMKPGEWVEKGAVLANIHAADGASAERAREQLGHAFFIQSGPPTVEPLIAEVVH